MKEYYSILGVSETATSEEIKKAYRKKARQHHPDLNPEGANEDEFKRVTQAYDVLSNPETRRQYDRYGAGGQPTGGFGFGDLDDIINSFFGGGFSSGTPTTHGPKPRGVPGQDALIRVKASLKDAVFGAEKKVEISTAITCDICGGSGCEPGTHPVECSLCQGQGSIVEQRRTLLGDMVTESVCPQCEGYGNIIESPCHECRGEGRIRTQETLMVDVPPGVNTQSTIRLNGQAEAGIQGGPAGDLYVEFEVQDDPIFSREKDNLLASLSIPMTAAALGTDITFETFDGPQILDIKAGLQSGDIITLKNLGVARSVHNPHDRGDLKVSVQVETPTDLSKEQWELLQQLATARDEKYTEGKILESASLFSKIRDLLN